MVGIILAIGNIIIVGLYVFSLITLVTLLKTSKYRRFDQEALFKRNILLESISVAESYLASKYNGAIFANSKINDIRCKKYNNAIIALEYMIVIYIILEFIKNLM